MRTISIDQQVRATVIQKLAAIMATSALMAFSLGPIEAKAADVLVNCSVSGTFTVAEVSGQLVAKNASTCSGTAVIPEGVQRIDLFQNNSNLLRVDVPASVTTIAGFAFANSGNLATFTVAPNSNLTRIPEYAFSNTKVAALEVPARVTAIGDAAFAGTRALTSLTFEAGSQLQTIGASAFSGTRLTSVSFPDSLVTLGNDSFKDNTTLTSVTFGAGSQLTTIGNNVFSGLPQSSIDLPASVTSIGSGIFGSNVRISISDSNPNYSAQNGVLFNKNRTTLIAYAPWLTDATYEIPNTVTTLSGSSFANSQLQTLNIPATVTTIGGYTFAGSSRLTEVTFSANSTLTRIPSAAFQSSGLLRIQIPASVTLIEGYALNTSLLEQVTFASNSALVEISNNVFSSARLRAIEIPASVQNIGEDAFSGNNLLTSMTFAPGSNLRYLGARAIRNSPLTTFTLPSTPLRSGYRFTGWSNTSNGTVISNPTTSALAGGALFAKWLQLSTVTFNPSSGSAVANGSFGLGESIAAPTPPTRTGFAFDGWALTRSGTAITFPYQPTSSANITLYALWEEIPTISAGSVTDSQVVSIPSGLTAAEVPASGNLPKVSLAFTATSSSAVVTLVPIDNPAAASATPFVVTGTTKIVDIQVSGISGPVTVCLDGASTDDIFHFTSGAWVALPQRSYVNGQVCGVTESFSPFSAAEPRALTPVASSGPTGPRLTLASRVAVTTNGQSLALKGVQLSEIFSVKLGGKDIKVIKQTDGEMVIEVPAGDEGFPTLELKHSSGTLTYYRMIHVVKPYEQTRSIKITKFVGSRPTLAGLSALYKVYRADTSVNVLTCVITVASDAAADEITKAETLGKSTCQRVVNYSRQIKNAQILVKKDGPVGSKPTVEITFDRTLGGQ
jgi:uncharacterized repeat protein (TIGR02543 family)